MIRTVIKGSGSYIPPHVKTNAEFEATNFYGDDQVRIETAPDVVVEKFRQITGIYERRYVPDSMSNSDMAIIAAKEAIADSGIDPESLDQIIVAHNFGDVTLNTIQTDAVPSLAARVKKGLEIRNPSCVAYDILFGCPGWIQGMIQADAFIKAGMAKKCLIIGTETLSRVIDKYDRDSMIFSDGAGACVIEGVEGGESGILSTSALTHSIDEVGYITMDKSYYPDSDEKVRYLKMKGRKVYEYAMKHVPEAMKNCIEKSGVPIDQIKKVFLHQANEKMDEGIIKAMYKLYGKEVPEYIMPMSIHNLGNSSVATVPTLYDMVVKGKMPDHSLSKGDVILFASVGAGMNINAVCYRM